mmetsp:Transcript_20940/g.35094  ORF Transcript_20940/g.35094 Transcript_20940/m.35094 type:complete len:217 (+) Transcript_20940:688-1338(+)
MILSSAPFSSSIAFLASTVARPPLDTRSSRFSIWDMSAKISSRLMVSTSEAGFTAPSTCTTFSSSKQRTTCTIMSHSRMWERNLLPRPAPSLAPFTKPAMSTNSTVVGTALSDLLRFDSTSRRSSGTATSPTLGSIVQKGKFAASALPFSTNALNSVDLPTFGRPTNPVFSAMLVDALNPRREKKGVTAAQRRPTPAVNVEVREAIGRRTVCVADP